VQVAAHPAYRVLTLRAAPLVAEGAVKYTSFNWNAILKRVLQMFITHTTCTERLDWSQQVGTPTVSQGFRGKHNKSAGSFAVFRGLFAGQVDASCLQEPTLYPAWQSSPLTTAASATNFCDYEMACTLLSADQVWCSHSLQHVSP
jgi:hypothetical protein